MAKNTRRMKHAWPGKYIIQNITAGSLYYWGYINQEMLFQCISVDRRKNKVKAYPMGSTEIVTFYLGDVRLATDKEVADYVTRKIEGAEPLNFSPVWQGYGQMLVNPENYIVLKNLLYP